MIEKKEYKAKIMKNKKEEKEKFSKIKRTKYITNIKIENFVLL